MASEFAYWAGLSGLVPDDDYSLRDHQYAAMVALTGSTDSPSFDTLKHRYYQTLTAGGLDSDLSRTDYEREYYLSQL